MNKLIIIILSFWQCGTIYRESYHCRTPHKYWTKRRRWRWRWKILLDVLWSDHIFTRVKIIHYLENHNALIYRVQWRRKWAQGWPITWINKPNFKQCTLFFFVFTFCFLCFLNVTNVCLAYLFSRSGNPGVWSFLYWKYFDWSQTLLLCNHLRGALFDNFVCVACMIFALTAFKGNDLLFDLCTCKYKTFCMRRRFSAVLFIAYFLSIFLWITQFVTQNGIDFQLYFTFVFKVLQTSETLKTRWKSNHNLPGMNVIIC